MDIFIKLNIIITFIFDKINNDKVECFKTMRFEEKTECVKYQSIKNIVYIINSLLFLEVYLPFFNALKV